MTSLGISFGTDGFFYGLVIPLVLIQLIALLLIPALLRSTSRIEDITRAITACIGKTLGALLMSAAVLPFLLSILSRQMFDDTVYLGLLLLFCVGALAYIVHAALLQSVDATARAVPSAIFFSMWKVFGTILALFSFTTLLLRMILGGLLLSNDAWAMQVVLFFYGVVLLWLTWENPGTQRKAFQSTSIATRPAAAKKPARRR